MFNPSLINMTNQTQCRFCLEITHTQENPLLQPCACRGSVENVHLQCLILWRNAAENSYNGRNCQLCKSKYIIPTRWAIQSYPENGVLQFLLSRFYLMIMLIQLSHFTIVNNTDYSILFYTQYGAYTFHGLLTCVTILYIYYIHSLISNVTAKRIYAQFMLSGQTMYPNYHSTVFLIIAFYACSIVNPVLFGYSYLYMLPNLIEAHNNVITQMNLEAEYAITV